MSDDAPMETLSYAPQGSGRGRSLARRVSVITCLVVALVAGSVLAAADRSQRASEAQALDRCASAAGSASDMADRRLEATADYIAPAVDPPRVDPVSGLHSLLGREAATSLPAVDHAWQRCRAVSVRWWHSGHRAAQRAYVDFLDAELDRLTRISGDGQAYYAGAGGVRQLRIQAETAWPVRTPSSP